MAKFCLCLPLRFGVLVISFFQSALYGMAAAALWYLVVRDRTLQNASKKLEIATIVFAGFYSVIALLMLAGFIGAIIKKSSFVRAYSSTINWILGFQIGITIVYLALLFLESKDTFVKNCINGSTDQDIINSCNNAANTSKPIIIISSIIPLLIQLYACIVVAQYSQLLKEKESGRSIILEAASGYTYQPTRTHEDTRPLTQSEVHYPYADNAHSYGNKGV